MWLFTPKCDFLLENKKKHFIWEARDLNYKINLRSPKLGILPKYFLGWILSEIFNISQIKNTVSIENDMYDSKVELSNIQYVLIFRI